MNAAWTAVLIGGLFGGGGVGGLIWHAAKLTAILEQLRDGYGDHEKRIRSLELTTPSSRR